MKLKAFSAIISTALLSGCVAQGGLVSAGSAPTAVTGAAAGGTAVAAQEGIQRCEAPLGTLAVDDDRERDWSAFFGENTKITTIEPLIRLAVLQSNCFVITSIGNSKTEEKLTRITEQQRYSQEFRSNSNQHAGQRVAADYLLETHMIMDSESAGSVSAGMEAGSAAGLAGALIGAVAGSIASQMESKVSVVTLSMFDIRSGVQVAMAEGNATEKNYGMTMRAFHPSGAARISAYSRTPEGKATVAAFMDAYNSMVIALRNYKTQQVEGGLGAGGILKIAE